MWRAAWDWCVPGTGEARSRPGSCSVGLSWKRHLSLQRGEKLEEPPNISAGRSAVGPLCIPVTWRPWPQDSGGPTPRTVHRGVPWTPPKRRCQDSVGGQTVAGWWLWVQSWLSSCLLGPSPAGAGPQRRRAECGRLLCLPWWFRGRVFSQMHLNAFSGELRRLGQGAPFLFPSKPRRCPKVYLLPASLLCSFSHQIQVTMGGGGGGCGAAPTPRALA